MNDCDPSEHQIFDTCVFIVDITSLENQHDQDTLGRVSRYIKERGGCVLVATSTDPASASIEIRPMPSQRMQCTHIIAEYGCKGERWNALMSEASKRHLDMHAVQVVNLVWVFACLQAHKLLPCHVDVYKGDTGSIGENAKDCTGRDECAMIYADDTMDVRMSASCSGFKKTARKLVEVMTASLGITFHKAMHVSGITKTDVLIVLDTSDESSEKLHAARNANIPVVNFIWLLDSYKEWKLLPLNDPRYKNGSESDLDRLIIDTAEYNDPNSVNVVPDSVDHSQESIQECSQTPPLENISDIPGANLAALQTASSGHTKEDIHNEKEYKSVADDVCSADAVHPISQDLSSTPSGLGDHSPRKTGTHLERENSGNVDGVTNNDDNDANISPHRDEAERAASDDDEEEGRHIDSHPAVGAQTTKRRRSSRLSSRNDPKIESEPDQRSNITREVDNTATKKRKKRNDDAPHIALSGMHSKEQHECIKLLRALQVPFTAGKHSWSPKFTHIITSSLRRNQKCLCALACGAWILHPSFVKASLSSSHQLAKEEPYEIRSGDKTTGIDPNTPTFWRRTIARSGKRAFEGLVCSLYHITSSHAPSKEDVRAIITAGGGTVVPLPHLTRTSTQRACDLIISSDAESAKESLQGSYDPKRIVSSSYIVSWLTSRSTALSSQGMTERVRSLLAMRSGHDMA